MRRQVPQRHGKLEGYAPRLPTRPETEACGELTLPRPHLGLLGLPATSGRSGRLALAALAPGEYDLFLESASNPATLATGLPYGFLARASVGPLETAEIEATVEAE